MEKSKNPSIEAEEKAKDLVLVSQLPKVQIWDGFDLYKYQGFWCPAASINGVICFQKHYQAEESDVILITFPKSGTTWLKALAFTIVNRSRYALENSPLLTTSPHHLVPFVELNLYDQNSQKLDFERFSSSTRRIFSTHIPYASLPGSILNSNCRIVYMCRNPLDQFISDWPFVPRLQNLEPSQVDEAFERTCQGIQGFGPIWEHVLGYWKASLEEPNKILFLKYEDLQVDVNFYINRLADFWGCPFSEDEVTQGVVEQIAKLCSFDNIKDLEVTKTGRVFPKGAKYSLFLRKGKVGDWKNYLTPSMSQRLEKIVEEKLVGSGLAFKTSLE